MTSTITSVTATMKDLYPLPGSRIKQWVVDMRRVLAWERETCPRYQIPAHDDDTGAVCRNGDSMLPWVDYREHDCCSRCDDFAEKERYRPVVVDWLAERVRQLDSICADRSKFSDEIEPDRSLMPNPLLAMLPKGKP